MKQTIFSTCIVSLLTELSDASNLKTQLNAAQWGGDDDYDFFDEYEDYDYDYDYDGDNYDDDDYWYYSDEDKPTPQPSPPKPNPDPKSDTEPQPQPEPKPSPSPKNIPLPLGDCVIADTSGEVPTNLYSNTGVVATTQYAPFTKSLTVRGIMLLARDEISSSFLEKVGATIEEMLPVPQ